MPLRTSLLVVCLASAATAQLSLPILPTGNAYLWGPPPATSQVFFDMTVNTTITLQGITYNGYTPVGNSGSIDIWLTNPGTTTYVGNELNAALWSLTASGPTVYPATPAVPSACFTTGATLQPGTYGVAVRYNGVGPLFYLGNGTNQAFSNAELSVTAGATQYSAFTAGAATPYVFSGTLFYGLGAVPHNCATKSEYGSGCYSTSGSFWQRWTTAGATAAALNGRTLTLANTGSGYLVTPGVGVTYVAPSGTATSLPTSSNGEAVVPLPSPLVHPGGVANALYVSVNGFVSDAPNATPPGSLSNLPNSGGLLNSAATMWALAWHDFTTAEVGSGLIKYEQVGTLFLITWHGVESWPGTVLNPSTLQIQFDLANGNVNYVWVTMDAVGGSAYYDYTLVGFSVGGVSPKVAATDITTLTSLVLTAPEVLPVTLVASAQPVLGTSINLTTSNEGVPGLGVNFLGTVAIPAPGFDLGILGAPGCAALIDPNAAVGNLISNLGAPLPTMTVAFPIPLNPGLAGLVIVSQSVFLDAAANPFGLKSSNGVSMTLGLFGL